MAPSLSSVARLGAAALAAAGAASLVAACGTSSPAPAPTRTVTQTTPAGAGGSSPAGTVTPAAATSPATGPGGCLATDLQAKLGVSQGTAGTIYQVVVLTNTSAATCTLYGYPGVSFVTGQGGSQVGKPASKDTADTPVLVTLAPGGSANALLAVHDAGAYSSSSCKLTSVDWLRIYPPGDYGAVYVHYNTQACASPSVSIMSVTAVRSGPGSASY